MSFGFGVGDLLTVINLANKIRKHFSGAPEQFRDIAAEVRNLAGILQDVDTYVAGHELAAVQERKLGEIEENCRRVLNNIEKFIDENSSLQTGRKDAMERMKRVWQRVTWDPNDTRDLRDQVISSSISLNTFLTALNASATSATNENVIKLVTKQQEQQNSEILQWLAPLDYTAQHSDHLRECLAGTGHWLIESPTYQKWLHTKAQMLFLHGTPGAGKTILSSMIINSLQSRCQTENSMAVCYFYCDYRRRKEQRFDGIMLRLLRQLVDMALIVPSEIQDLYDRHQRYRTRPASEEIRVALVSIAKSFSMTYIIIDALDECQTADNCQGELIDALLGLHGSGHVNIAVTSRPIPNIRTKFSSCESLEIRASSDDIGRYVEENLKNLPKFVANSIVLQQEIKSQVTANVDGMYVVRCVLAHDSMRGKRSATQLRRLLASLASGANSYKEAYTKTMEGLQSQVRDQVEVAIEALMWIVSARRPLTSTELLNALAVEHDTKEFDKDNIPDLDDTISACCGLVTVEAESKIVRLVHYTTHEFFESEDGRVWLRGAQQKLAEKCITYLSFGEFSSGICETLGDWNYRTYFYPLYKYSSQFWGDHARLCGDSALVRLFLSKKQQFQASSQMLLIQDTGYDNDIIQYFHSQEVFYMSPLSIVAHFGLQDILYEFLDKQSINATDINLRTPLSYAAAHGQISLVQLLLEKGAVIEFPDKDSRTPLQWAARNGHVDVLSLLLTKVSSCDSHHVTMALLEAADRGQDSAIDVLLDKGANIQGSDQKDLTVLHMASSMERGSTVALLFSRGARINVQDDDGWTPLMWAVAVDNLSITTFLLEHGAKLNIKNKEGMTALMIGSRNAVECSIIRALLDHGEEVSAVDNNQYSALHYATLMSTFEMDDWSWKRPGQIEMKYTKRRVDIVSCLLDHKADLLGLTSDGWSALGLAAKSGNLKVVHLLMDTYHCRRLDIDLTAILDGRDEHGRNILHHIAKQNDFNLLEQFTQPSLSSKFYDKHGKSTLDYAVISGNEKMVLLLLDKIPSENLASNSDSSWSSLHWACRQGSFDLIHILAARGYAAKTVKTTYPDAQWTPLDVAVYFGNTRLISATNCDLDARHRWHDTIASGIVDRDTSSGVTIPVRANPLKQIAVSYGAYCEGCLTVCARNLIIALLTANIRQKFHALFASCHNCGNRYCFMCAKNASSFHIKHRSITCSTACLNGGVCEYTCIRQKEPCAGGICCVRDWSTTLPRARILARTRLVRANS